MKGIRSLLFIFSLLLLYPSIAQNTKDTLRIYDQNELIYVGNPPQTFGDRSLGKMISIGKYSPNANLGGASGLGIFVKIGHYAAEYNSNQNYSNQNLYIGYEANRDFGDSYYSYHTAIGNFSNYLNRGGGSNFSMGYKSQFNRGLGNSVGIGDSAIFNNQFGNVLGIGRRNFRNSSCSSCIGIGIGVMENLDPNSTTNRLNSGIGYHALNQLYSGNFNFAFGSNALFNLYSGNSNWSFGTNSLDNLYEGLENLAIGNYSLTSLTITSNNNIAMGDSSLFYLSQGSKNIGIGSKSGKNFRNGTGNISIGINNDFQSSTGSDQLSLGNSFFGKNINSTGNAIFELRNLSSLSASSNLDFRVNGPVFYSGTISSSSDKRLKEKIRPLSTNLEKVLQLDPVQFNWDKTKIPGADNSIHLGLLAQMVEEVFPDLVNAAQDSIQTKSIDYQGLIAILTEVLQAQIKQYESLKK